MPPKKDAVPHTFAIGDIVLGRIKGYPPWPAKIVDPDKEFLQKEVLAAKGKGKKNAFLVRYYPDATYSWSPGNELKPLSRKDIDTYVANNDKGGKGTLLVAYKTAQDPDAWEASHEIRMEKKRNSNEDELDPDEDDDEPEDRPTGSKRKAGKGKATANKKSKPDNKKPEKKEKKVDKKKDEVLLEEGGKKCKEWRHKLQRAFLSDSVPKAEQMPDFDKIFDEMERFTFQGEWLTATKLPKVLRRIHGLDNIPEDDKFQIKKRAGNLVENWKTLVPEGKEGGEEANPSPVAPSVPKDEPMPAAQEEGDLTVADQSMAVDAPEQPKAEPKAEEAPADVAPAESAPAENTAEPQVSEPAAETEAVDAKEGEVAPAQGALSTEEAPKVNGDAAPPESVEQPAVNGDVQMAGPEPAVATEQEPSKTEAEAPKAEPDAAPAPFEAAAASQPPAAS